MTGIDRRHFLGGAVAAPFVSRRALARPVDGSVLRSKVIADLKALDPFWSTAYVTRNHGYMVFDTLFGFDARLNVAPQMVDSYSRSADHTVYDFHLRDGLFFHDGMPVRSADCVASLQRWMKKDFLGARIATVLDRFEIVDARHFRIRLKQPWSLLVEALGKPGANVAFIMPERLARTSPSVQVTEMIGSGPFKFARAEFRPGARAVYLRNDAYRPRAELASGTAGGKRVLVDRVEWLFMDDMTAGNALQGGEIDFIEEPSPELLPVLRGMKDVVVEVDNEIGTQLVIRPNHTQPPFDNVLIRRAMMEMLDTRQHLLIYAGDKTLIDASPSAYPPGTPYWSEQGLPRRPDRARAHALLRQGGYRGEPIVVLQATDIATNRIFSTVTAQQLREGGFNVRVEASDFGTMFARVMKNAPAGQGIWHVLHFANMGADQQDPIVNRYLSGAGDAWGKARDAEVERLRARFLLETDPRARRAIAQAVQVRALDQVFYVSGGSFKQPNAYRNSLHGVLKSPVPVYWNIAKRA